MFTPGKRKKQLYVYTWKEEETTVNNKSAEKSLYMNYSTP